MGKEATELKWEIPRLRVGKVRDGRDYLIHQAEQRSTRCYRCDGYIVVENLVSPEEVEALGSRVREYTHGGRPPGGLRVQMEPRIQRGELEIARPGDGIRKIDGLVEEDDLFRRLGLNEGIVGILAQILGPDIKMFVIPASETASGRLAEGNAPGFALLAHREPDLCSCWFTLDDATAENGCMGVLPGWHRKGPLPHLRVPNDSHVDFVVDETCYDFGEMVLVPMQAGSGLFFHSLLPHYTAPNRSDRWRRAIALSCMSAKSRYTGEGKGPEYFHIMGRSYPGCVR